MSMSPRNLRIVLKNHENYGSQIKWVNERSVCVGREREREREIRF